MSIESRQALNAKKEEAVKALAAYDCRIMVCAGTGCIATGSQVIYEIMSGLCHNLDNATVEFEGHVPHIGVANTGCQGICELGPLVRIEPYHYQYVKVKPEDCQEIFEKTVLNGQPCWSTASTLTLCLCTSTSPPAAMPPWPRPCLS